MTRHSDPERIIIVTSPFYARALVSPKAKFRDGLDDYPHPKWKNAKSTGKNT